MKSYQERNFLVRGFSEDFNSALTVHYLPSTSAFIHIHYLNISIFLSVKESGFILLQTVPSHINLDGIKGKLEKVRHLMMTTLNIQIICRNLHIYSKGVVTTVYFNNIKNPNIASFQTV